MHYNELRKMEEANEYWRAKYGSLEYERDFALHNSMNSKIDLSEIKEIINRYK